MVFNNVLIHNLFIEMKPHGGLYSPIGISVCQLFLDFLGYVKLHCFSEMKEKLEGSLITTFLFNQNLSQKKILMTFFTKRIVGQMTHNQIREMGFTVIKIFLYKYCFEKAGESVCFSYDCECWQDKKTLIKRITIFLFTQYNVQCFKECFFL